MPRNLHPRRSGRNGRGRWAALFQVRRGPTIHPRAREVDEDRLPDHIGTAVFEHSLSQRLKERKPLQSGLAGNRMVYLREVPVGCVKESWSAQPGTRCEDQRRENIRILLFDGQ